MIIFSGLSRNVELSFPKHRLQEFQLRSLNSRKREYSGYAVLLWTSLEVSLIAVLKCGSISGPKFIRLHTTSVSPITNSRLFATHLWSDVSIIIAIPKLQLWKKPQNLWTRSNAFPPSLELEISIWTIYH
jgi:hypothetical protein